MRHACSRSTCFDTTASTSWHRPLRCTQLSSVAHVRTLGRCKSTCIARATQGGDQHATQQQKQLHSSISRRQSLAGIGALLGLLPGAATASPSSDLVEGTQNWLHLGVESYNLWWQGLVDGIANDDQTGLTAEQQGQRKARRFGSISVPGLSSFSFIHGTLVGATLIALISLAGSGSARQQEQQQQQLPALRPEVEAALARLLASPETSSTFHDPAVHAALQDVRADLRNINKYRDDPAVMTAFQKLLEIEDILERL